MQTEIAPRALPSPAGLTCAMLESVAPQQSLALRLDDGRLIPLEHRLQIGTATANDLVLEDPFVSAVHCSIVKQAGRVLLKDMGSRNGCWLGATRVRLAELAAGARLTIGGTSCEVVCIEERGHPILGTSAVIVQLRRDLTRVGLTGLSVLLLGESGSGKELAADAIHAASRRQGKLVAVNCGALSAEVVESELFGHERGAFTGAVGRRIGLFEEAEGGTLFFDEIGELPLSLQPKLLRALETGLVRPVGSSSERRVNVRVIAATHRKLGAAASRGAFRLDLYHRLAAIEVRLPALRERPDDIPLLARHFLDASGAGGPARRFSSEAQAAMAQHQWPGNVRELKNAVLRASHLGGAVIEPADLFPGWRVSQEQEAADGQQGSLASDGDIPEMEAMQRRLVVRALQQHRGNVRAAARALGMAHSTLHDRIKRWRLPSLPGLP